MGTEKFIVVIITVYIAAFDEEINGGDFPFVKIIGKSNFGFSKIFADTFKRFFIQIPDNLIITLTDLKRSMKRIISHFRVVKKL